MSPTPARAIRVDNLLRWLLGVFLGGLLLVVGLRVFFDDMQTELSQHSANERARLFVGEEIVRGIHGIEKDIYQMAVTTNPGGVKLIRRQIDKQISKLTHDLSVLEKGGTVRREVLLNLEGRDEMVREVTFTPVAGEQAYVMELVEIAPLLEQISEKMNQLERLLDRRWDTQEIGDKNSFFLGEQEIASFLKHIPPFFKRLDENSNRLFYDSSERLRLLDAEINLQKERLVKVEMGFIALVVILVVLAATLIAWRINLANKAREQALYEAGLARDAAEKASRTKSDFVSRMSHELRTPLNAIIGFAQLLESEPLPPSQKNYVSLINSSGNHLLELINAVLDHAKIEAGGLTLEKISFDFPAAIESVRSIVLDRASSKGLEFVAEIDQNIPRRVVGDPTRLRQVLINLLVNAVKFTEYGSVELRVAVDDGLLVFSIRDSGIGMNEEMLGRLFQPFSQADETITRKYGGTGLGLLISKELIEAMDGTIEVESARGVGTCFWIRLPLEVSGEQVNPETDISSVTSLSNEAIAALINGRVLLVDDNRVNQQLGSAMLERIGLEHDFANHGRQALERMAVNDYALILMDMEMPEMDGLSATREIRRREEVKGEGKHVTIIAMTANALAEDRERCFAAGMDGFISKPISLLALGNEIRRLFGAAPLPMSGPVERVSITDQVAFDHAAVIEMLGDEELFQQLAGMFVQDAPNNLDELDSALANGSWPDLARVAHTLKGLAGTFAAAPAEAEARQLEHAAQAGDAALCQSLVPVVREKIESLVTALKATLQ